MSLGNIILWGGPSNTQPLFAEASWKLIYLILRFVHIHLTKHLPYRTRPHRPAPPQGSGPIFPVILEAIETPWPRIAALQVPAILDRSIVGELRSSESSDLGQAMNRSLLVGAFPWAYRR
jgi:hypothetical protein